MRTVPLLLLAMLAITPTAVTTASGQEACTKSYTGCMDRCVTRPSQSLQDTCMETCQTQARACFSEGSGDPATNVQTVQDTPAPPRNEPARAAAPAKPAAKTAKPAERRSQ